MKIERPGNKEYPAYYDTYINKVSGNDLVATLEMRKTETIKFLQGVPTEKLGYKYQEGKWTIKEIIVHLMDAERIFVYRALRFSRSDRTNLPGFDENEYVPHSGAGERTVENILAEYNSLRVSTIDFFKNLSEEMAHRIGIANGHEISVRSLGYIIAGHEIHHLGVISERYL